ncbi:hypothetical protein IEQ34_022150 [Dendrobium chrysotoxum]|uniref:Uncharacterized protein n=1 Tax=Dendrobium chrysotoxum TaxID=161865 RepID=A0AAV7FK05_DENCH|nr:hypothetical protein IEQ34_022150 [Dendrobium chrysotoxum]
MLIGISMNWECGSINGSDSDHIAQCTATILMAIHRVPFQQFQQFRLYCFTALICNLSETSNRLSFVNDKIVSYNLSIRAMIFVIDWYYDLCNRLVGHFGHFTNFAVRDVDKLMIRLASHL